jgi:endonuclease/exonuclease/phosphatase family metal-dependent hydrolase
MPSVVVASYNVHGGVDGWGRPFDVVEACRAIEADVLVLQESWGADGRQSVAQRVADALGYRLTELTLARGRIAVPTVPPGRPWGPRLWDRTHFGMRLDRRHRAPSTGGGSASTNDATGVAAAPRSTTDLAIERGTWGIAVLTRLEVRASRTFYFGQLPTDPARRGVIVTELAPAPGAPSLHVVGTHLAHLSQGSPRHIAVLRRAVRDLVGAPAVLAGDMNLWGPPLSLLLPGWSRAVRGRSWPTWSRWLLAQTDHLLVSRALRATSGEVLRVPGSDHFPVRARIPLA